MSQQTGSMPEEMARFFDVRAEGYEDHMRTEVYKDDLEPFYTRVVSAISDTTEPIRVLDLGCGTGLELAPIFQKAPNAMVTGIDMSRKMLDLLGQKYASYAGQLCLKQGSYVKIPFEKDEYDYIISVMSIHHLLEEAKLELYRKIRTALKYGGTYLEGDYVVDATEEQQFLKEYHKTMQYVDPEIHYHIDIPFSIERQERLFTQAGFCEVNTVYHVENRAIFIARKNTQGY